MIRSRSKQYIVFSIAMITLLLISMFLTPQPEVAEAVGNNTNYQVSYEQSDVTGDLEGVDLTKYAGLGTISLISFNEFGFDYMDMSGYGLYMYIYNSTGKSITDYSAGNKVQLSVDGKTYNKYFMSILDKSEDNTVYKVKIIDDGSIKSAITGKSARVYNISGMEWIISSIGVEDFPIATKFTYTGVPAMGEGEVSTLQCNVEQQDTVVITGLKDRQTVYRTDMDNQNMSSHNQVNSVYFAIDDYFLTTYGQLQSIEAEWWEYRTNQIVVTNNEELYYTLRAMPKNIDGHNCEYDWGIGERDKGDLLGNYASYNWSYNLKTYTTALGNGIESTNQLSNLYWIFGTDVWGESIENYIIDSSDLEELRFNHEQSQIANFSEEDNGYRYCTDLFNTNVGEGRTAGYNRKLFDVDDPDSMINFTQYDPDYQGWDLFKNLFGWEDDFDEVLKDQSPFFVINSENMGEYLSGSNEAVADRLLIAEEDVSNFKAYATNSIAKGESVVLFRFACTEYNAAALDVYKYAEHTAHIATTYDDIAFGAQENVFLNFDIMTLGFRDGYNYTVIPVVSSPIDIISDIVGPELPGNGWGIMDYVYFAIMAVVAVILFVILYCILDAVMSGIYYAAKRSNNSNRKYKRKKHY